MFLNLILILVSFALAAFLYVKKSYSFWADHGVPFIEPRFPYGNMKVAGRKEHFSFLTARLYNEMKNNSPITGLYFFLRPTVLVTKLSFAQKIFIKDFNNFEDRGHYYNAKDDPLSAHLFNLESAKWKPLRSKLSPTFTSGRMKFMFPTIVSVGHQFVECISTEMKDGHELEIRDLLGRFTTDVIGTCAFGIECNSLKDPNTKFRQMGKRVFDQPKISTLMRVLMVSNQNLARFFGLRLHDPDVTDFFLNIVEQTIEFRERNNVQRNDFMDLLIQLKNDGHLKGDANTEQNQLTVTEIAAQAFLFFLAGFETSSTTLTFALYELAQPHNKYIQDRARAEVCSVLAKHGGQLTYEAIKEMSYVEQVIYESLRKYPPVGNLSRVVTKDYDCAEAKMVFRKGMSIVIPVYGIHHDPDIYAQPEEFRPERFSAEEVKKRPSCSYLPFGDGPRNCIGLRFGMMQARIALVLLLQHFQFTTCDRTLAFPMKISADKFILSPIDGVWLHIEHV